MCFGENCFAVGVAKLPDGDERVRAHVGEDVGVGSVVWNAREGKSRLMCGCHGGGVVWEMYLERMEGWAFLKAGRVIVDVVAGGACIEDAEGLGRRAKPTSLK